MLISVSMFYAYFSIYARDRYSTSAQEFLTLLICSGCSGHGACNYGTLAEHQVSCTCDVGWQGTNQ